MFARFDFLGIQIDTDFGVDDYIFAVVLDAGDGTRTADPAG